MNKKDIVTGITILALLLSIANMYVYYNTMNELDNLFSKFSKIEETVEHNRQTLIGIQEFWDLSQYNFIIVPTSRMEIYAEVEMNGGIARFWHNEDKAIMTVTLPLNTTYRIEIFTYSGTQTPLTMGSALEVIIDEEVWGIFTFTAEDWKWKYIGTRQLNAGQHTIQLINREGGALGDRNSLIKELRIMWFK